MPRKGASWRFDMRPTTQHDSYKTLRRKIETAASRTEVATIASNMVMEVLEGDARITDAQAQELVAIARKRSATFPLPR